MRRFLLHSICYAIITTFSIISFADDKNDSSATQISQNYRATHGPPTTAEIEEAKQQLMTNHFDDTPSGKLHRFETLLEIIQEQFQLVARDKNIEAMVNAGQKIQIPDNYMPSKDRIKHLKLSITASQLYRDELRKILLTPSPTNLEPKLTIEIQKVFDNSTKTIDDYKRKFDAL